MSKPLAGVVALALLLQGCASPGRSLGQTVRVETPGCERASCELNNDRGSWRVAATPGSVELRTSSLPLRVACRSDSGVVASVDVAASAPARTATAPLVGGAAGGAAVGASIGAAGLSFIPALGVLALLTGVAGGALAGEVAADQIRPLSYPERVVVPMNCAAPAAPQPPVAPLGLLVRGLTPHDASALGLSAARGVQVLRVDPGSRAAAAGLLAGDVLLEMAGQPLQDPADLESRLRALAPTVPIALRLWRQGRALDLILPGAEPTQ